MAVPRKKTSKSCRNMRRAHDALTALNLCPCIKCGAPRLPHSVCETCGTYGTAKKSKVERSLPQRYLKASLSVG